MGGVSRAKRDIYYRAAREFGFRARSAFKLLQLDEHYNLFRDSQHAVGQEQPNDEQQQQADADLAPAPLTLRVVDLCAAPGGWTEVCQLRMAATGAIEHSPPIIAVDLQSMAPMAGVLQIRADLTRQSTADEIIAALQGELADLVLSDGAPDVTGLHSVDESLQHTLLLSCLELSHRILADGGTFVGKVFRGPNAVRRILAPLVPWFAHVDIAKPRASRAASIEGFIVCRRYKRDAYMQHQMRQLSVASTDSTIAGARSSDKTSRNAEQLVDTSVKFVSCPGGFRYVKSADQQQCADLDSDATYPSTYRLKSVTLDAADEPIRVINNQPIDPPYKRALEMRRNNAIAR